MKNYPDFIEDSRQSRNNEKFKIIFLAIIFLGIFLFTKSSQAVVTLTNGQWSSTFNCADWQQPNILSNCDGMSKWGDWFASGYPDAIRSQANYSGGVGGKGLTHWRCVGHNVGGSGPGISFPTPQREFWMRWYMRYPIGYNFNNYEKIFYFDPVSQHGTYVPNMMPNYIRSAAVAAGTYVSLTSNYGFQQINGGVYGDGQWHEYEWHFKLDTNGSNGVAEVWVDNVFRGGTYTQNLNGTLYSGVGSIEIGDNQGDVVSHDGVTQCYAVDYDDITISTTGYIGPLGGVPPADTTAPAAPTGLTIQ